MFYVIPMKREVLVHPRHFDKNLVTVIKRLLAMEVEGSYSPKFGYIISIISFTSIESGDLDSEEGHAVFSVQFNALVLRTLKGQAVLAQISDVNKVGIFADIGPISCFISKHNIPPGMKFEHNSAGQAKYISESLNKILKKNDFIRIRIMGLEVGPKSLFCVASIKEEFLGKID